MALLRPDISTLAHYNDRSKFLLIWRVSLLFGAIFFVLLFVELLLSTYTALFYLTAVLVIGGCTVYLHRTRNYLPVFRIYAYTATFLLAVALQSFTGMVHLSEYFWMLTLIVFAFVGLHYTEAYVILLLNLVSVGLYFLWNMNSDIDLLKPQTPEQQIGNFIEVAIAFVVIGYFLRQYVFFQRHAESELVKANAELADQNQVIARKHEENTTLAKEIHHRVKNNLQIIVSLLRMQRDEVRSEETRQHFSEAINRIMAMSLIHENLYGGEALSNIDFSTYLQQLSDEIIASCGDPALHRCTIVSDVQKVGLRTIVPVGLLINELMTNSIKHAFGTNSPGTISIEMRELPDERLVLIYNDSGQWKAIREGGFGLELIDLLVHQLEGKAERVNSRYELLLTNLDHA